MELRLPNIKGQTAEEQLQQIKSYMYQLVEQLNLTMSANVVTESGATIPVITKGKSNVSQEQNAQDTFNSIKSLIIKSAEIVNAYTEEMRKTFNGEYVAQSDFGTFINTSLSTIIANSESITQLYEDIQKLQGDYNSIKATNAWIKSGELDTDIYGIEVGQTTIVAGEEVFNKYARFTADGIYFYLPNYTDAVAKMTDKGLVITNATISGELRIGDYKISSDSSGLTLRYSGGAN